MEISVAPIAVVSVTAAGLVIAVALAIAVALETVTWVIAAPLVIGVVRVTVFQIAAAVG